MNKFTASNTVCSIAKSAEKPASQETLEQRQTKLFLLLCPCLPRHFWTSTRINNEIIHMIPEKK